MNAWSNIEISPDDREIASIDRMERTLGELPKKVADVRMLITRFEVCHFKYQTHYRHILQSIAMLKPTIDLNTIGAAHPRNGAQAVKADPTGRGQVGQRYIDALHTWLGQTDAVTDNTQTNINKRISLWLGERDGQKDELVTMLLDRLLYRLDGYDYQHMTGLALQVMKTDICCYAFPINIENVIQAIGKLAPVEDFHGCGTTNAGIRLTAGQWLQALCQWLKADSTDETLLPIIKSPERIWLVACLAKTIKEQIHSPASIPLPPL